MMTSICFFHQYTGLSNQQHLFQHRLNLFPLCKLMIIFLRALKGDFFTLSQFHGCIFNSCMISGHKSLRKICVQGFKM